MSGRKRGRDDDDDDDDDDTRHLRGKANSTKAKIKGKANFTSCKSFSTSYNHTSKNKSQQTHRGKKNWQGHGGKKNESKRIHYQRSEGSPRERSDGGESSGGDVSSGYNSRMRGGTTKSRERSHYLHYL